MTTPKWPHGYHVLATERRSDGETHATLLAHRSGVGFEIIIDHEHIGYRHIRINAADMPDVIAKLQAAVGGEP